MMTSTRISIAIARAPPTEPPALTAMSPVLLEAVGSGGRTGGVGVGVGMCVGVDVGMLLTDPEETKKEGL